MDYQYEVMNYSKNNPATITLMQLSSGTRKTELQWHREPEIVYVMEGTAECNHNGDSQLVEQGDFILFNSEDVHLVRPAGDGDCSLMCVNFSFEYIRMFCKSIDSMCFSVEEKPEIKEKINEVLKEISETSTENDYSELIRISLVNKLYYLLLSECVHYRRASGAANGTKRDFSYAKTAIAYINENFKREITLDEISGVVNLSPSYFSKYFKSVTQVSFSEYLANLRLENAINFMLTRNATVSAAAFENGFANVKSFITRCKTVYGCTPAQYKKKLLKKD